MNIVYQDKLLTCSECGNQFVYTIGQQRMALEEGVTTDPDLCPVCSVKVERMGRRSMEMAHVSHATTNGFHAQRNGHSHTNYVASDLDVYGDEDAPVRDQPQEHRTYHNGSQPHDASATSLSAEVEKAPSPNRPANYRSGNEHPLAGHGGETFAGYVKWFNDRKGFGFVTLDNGVEIFVHYSGIVSEGYKTLKQNQRVQLTIEDTGKGPQATQVMVIREEQPIDPATPGEFAEPTEFSEPTE